MPKKLIEPFENDSQLPASEPMLSGLRLLHAFAAARGDGLHPKLLAHAERAATRPVGHPTGQLGSGVTGPFPDPDRLPEATSSETGKETTQNERVSGETD